MATNYENKAVRNGYNVGDRVYNSISKKALTIVLSSRVVVDDDKDRYCTLGAVGENLSVYTRCDNQNYRHKIPASNINLPKLKEAMSIVSKEFAVAAVSENTNSFGLKQMVLIARDGSAFTGCFNSINVRQQGESIVGEVYSLGGNIINTTFRGGELIHEIEDAPKELIKKLFN
jgi:hypothetical protein